MNDLQKTETSLYFSNETGSTSCDITTNLIMPVAKLLGQYSKEDRSPEMKEQDENKLSPEFTFPAADMTKKLNFNMWNSVGPIKVNNNNNIQITDLDDEPVHRTHSEQFIANDEQVVNEVLSILNTDNKETLSKQFRAWSSSPEGCSLLRQSNRLPVLIQLIHGTGSNKVVREQASQALHSIVHHNPDEKEGRREGLVLQLIEEILAYCENEDHLEERSTNSAHPVQALGKLMKLSYDVEYRRAMCQFGALHALSKLIETVHERCDHCVTNLVGDDVTVRRYAAMALTNFTCGDKINKSLLSSQKAFMRALVAQLQSSNEDLCQVSAAVLRNLSWRAELHIREALRDVNAVKMLMKTVLRVQKEATLKACLYALWNLSAHNDLNKVDICNVDGAIEFLARSLNEQTRSGSSSPVIVENVGGILRNISKLIAVNDDFRKVLRKHNCLQNLLDQLKSPSLAIVNNACGTLWNLSARCEEDQCTLIELGAVTMLRSLTHSKHKMISVASTAALSNLMSSLVYHTFVDNSVAPATLAVRKQRALEQQEMAVRGDASELLDVNVSSSYERMAGLEVERRSDNRNECKRRSTDPASRFNSSPFDEGDNKHTTAAEPKTCTKEEMLQKVRENTFVCRRAAAEDEESDLKKSNDYRKLEEPYGVGDYTETDLDQPTNYSLRFSEQISYAHHDNERVEPPSTVKKGPSQLETPLMFSRSSSLDSVSSCGGAVDDQGSVISEFSRAVSGVVSPSELPDSPTQTVPQSPRAGARNMNRFYVPAVAGDLKANLAAGNQSVFEDTVRVFKDELTPIVFSVATSLSSLTFDDEPPQLGDELSPVREHETTLDANLECGGALVAEKTNTGSTASSKVTAVRGEEDEDEVDGLDVDMSLEEQQAMVEACIVSGKPTTSHKYSRRDHAAKYSPTDDTLTLSDECSLSRSTTTTTATTAARQQPSLLADSTINFCTEDTPISISHAASNSDLSLLCLSEDSFLQNSILPLSSCADDHDVTAGLPTEEQEKLLNLCIAKGKQTLSYSNNSLDDTKSSQSSTLSEITEDLSMDDRTLLKDMVASANLISMTTTCSITDDGVFFDDVANKHMSEEEEENLLNQCIVLGMRSMKESTTELENIGPPSFLAEANLDSSLMNVEEITDYPPCNNAAPTTLTPKQKRREMKERYQTYTVKQHMLAEKPSKDDGAEVPRKCALIRERKFSEKDRFKTRTLTKNDFVEIAAAKCQEGDERPQQVTDQEMIVSPAHSPNDDCSPTSESESYHEAAKAKIVKPVTKAVKSGIPIVRSKLPKAQSPVNTKPIPPSELPVSLQRQNTFTKDEPSGIPVRRNSTRGNSKINTSPENVSTPPKRGGIPSRIKEPSPKVASRGGLCDKSPDIVKNRWSISENNLNAASGVKATSNTSLNTSSTYSSTTTVKVSPSASHSALPVRRESSGRSSGLYAYKK